MKWIRAKQRTGIFAFLVYYGTIKQCSYSPIVKAIDLLSSVSESNDYKCEPIPPSQNAFIVKKMS